MNIYIINMKPVQIFVLSQSGCGFDVNYEDVSDLFIY